MPSQEIKRQVYAAAAAAEDKKAEDIRILALDPSESSLTDYFLICNGTNERQNVAIGDEIEARMKSEFGMYANSVEGRRQGEWILMDYVDFVVHIFSAEKREYYGLERLRKSATLVSMSDLDAELNNRVKAARKAAPAPISTKEEVSATTPTPAVDTHIAVARIEPKDIASVAPAVAKKTPKKKSIVKKAAKKAAPKPAAKKTVKAPTKKAAKKVVAKAPAKKAVAKKPVKKAVAKKAAPKKAVKAASKKIVKKVAAKKVVAKNPVKKAVVKKAAKKSAPKKVAAKKLIKKTAPKKKAPAKKVVAKKTAAKKPVKKAAKKKKK